jgi:hypothetical protein
LTINYIGLEPFNERTEKLSHYGFECKCILCVQDCKDATLEARKALFERIKNSMKMQLMPDLRKANDYLSQMEKLYRKSKVEREECMKLDMFYPLSMQAKYLSAMANYSQSSKIFMDLYQRYRAVNFYLSVFCLFQAVEILKHGSNKGELESAIKICKENIIGDQEYSRYIFLNRFADQKAIINLFNKL